MTLFIIALVFTGWAAVAVLGTQAYFRGEQTKPIHERNWNSEGFDRYAEAFTGQKTDYRERVPAYSLDVYQRNTLGE
ncbi:MAG: photosystem II protein, Psb35-related [Phormidium sp.]|nr:MAG: hypothetical protein HLUCCO16_08770 [Phormidium sp. OSCR]